MKKTVKAVSIAMLLSVSVAVAMTTQAAHYHWFCSVNRYTSAKYSKKDDSSYRAGVHAATYGHYKQTTWGSCSSSW